MLTIYQTITGLLDHTRGLWLGRVVSGCGVLPSFTRVNQLWPPWPSVVDSGSWPSCLPGTTGLSGTTSHVGTFKPRLSDPLESKTLPSADLPCQEVSGCSQGLCRWISGTRGC